MSTTTSEKRVTVNCPACGAVNADADVNTMCSACGEPVGGAVFRHMADEIKRVTEQFHERAAERSAPAFKTFNGFGTTLLDYRERGDGLWDATRWVVAMMLPVAPLGVYVIRPKRQENGYGRMESYFEVHGRAPLTPGRVLRPYLLTVVGLAPVVLGFVYSSWVNRTLGGGKAFLAMLACIAWAFYVIFFRIKNDSKAYKQAQGKKA